MATRMSSKARPKTLNRGAADARGLCKKAIRAVVAEYKASSGFNYVASAASRMIEKIDAQAKNASKRKGGMGRQ